VVFAGASEELHCFHAECRGYACDGDCFAALSGGEAVSVFWQLGRAAGGGAVAFDRYDGSSGAAVALGFAVPADLYWGCVCRCFGDQAAADFSGGYLWDSGDAGGALFGVAAGAGAVKEMLQLRALV
jgi:hypothetical protein